MTIDLSGLVRRLPALTRFQKRLEKSLYFFIFAFVATVVSLAGFGTLRFLQRIAAEQVCSLPVAPAVITTQIIVQPDSTDGIVNCESLDIIVGNGGELVFERNVTDNNNLNGDWGVTLLVNNLTVQAGGKINADGKGYLPQEAESVTGDGGSGAGNTAGSGGGYGGAGGTGMEDPGNPASLGGLAYGNQENPALLGSAGGNSGTGGNGGAGGGSIKIEASGTVQIDGELTANGIDGVAVSGSSGGGGAGGSIWIESNTLAGSGIVSANGGGAEEGTYQGGGGGGGRVQMFCTAANNFVGTAEANEGVTALSQDGGEGTVLGPTCRPDAPSVLKQIKSNQTTEILVGGVTAESTVIFAGSLADVDSSDTLALQIEVKELGVAFTNVPNYTQPVNFANPQNCLGAVTTCGRITVSNLTRSKEYHWQARVRDNSGGFSEWVSFGGNAESQRDVLLAGNAANIAIAGGNSQSAVVSTILGTDLTVLVTDSAGFPVPGYTVSWSILNGSGGGAFTQVNATTTDSGISSVKYRLGSSTGLNQVRASGSGLAGSPANFTLTGLPDVIHHFTLTAPQVAVVNTNFSPVVITAYDQYNNVKTDYDGLVALAPVEPTDTNTILAGLLTPASYDFSGSENGQVSISLQYNTADSIKIRAMDGVAVGYSNTVAIVVTLGSCPDPDGIIDVSQNWVADTNNQGIFDCRGLDLDVRDGAVLTLSPYNNGNTQVADDYGVTVLADNFTVRAGSFVRANGNGYIGSTVYGTLAHGGNGTTGGTPYGSVYEPDDLGAGGGSNYGGGAIKLVITGTTNVLGSITANGDASNSGSCGRAGGAGGSIWIVTSGFDGNGIISTNGTAQYNCSGAYPSGGRIAIYYSGGSYISSAGSNLLNLIQSRGGGGGPGTVYIEQTGTDPVQGANLYVDHNGTNAGYAALVQGTYQFETINLKRYGHLTVLGQTSELIVTDGAALQGDTTSPTLAAQGIFRYTGSSTLAINGVNVDIQGDLIMPFVDDIDIGTSLAGGLMLRARTWARNNSNPYEYGVINVGQYGTLSLVSYDDGVSGVTGDYGVQLTADTINVASGGLITADNYGYGAGTTAGKSLAYGGYATSGGSPYGDVYRPLSLGAPGSSGNNGGGAIHIIVDTLTINGTISSIGGSAVTGSCGRAAGTGGSILIDANTINSASTPGIIRANGSSQYNCSGLYPSGGRVAIYYTGGNYFSNMGSSNITDYVQARGLSGGGPGTVYLEQNGVDTAGSARLYVDNANSNGAQAGLIEDDYIFEKITLTRYGHLDVIGNSSTLTITDGSSIVGDTTSSNLGIQGTFIYTGNDALSINGVDIDIKGEINLVNSDDFNLGTVMIGGLILRANTWAHNNTIQYQFGDINIGASGTLTLISTYDGAAGTANDYGVRINAENINVQNGGRITADNYGYGSEQYLSHGGWGTTGSAYSPYGNVYQPTTLGAPGSSGNLGGGAIRLIVNNTLTINGIISADGGNAVSGSCGRAAGAGGSIWITATTISSSATAGVIRANGTSQYNCSGHYPSGGRVAIYYTNDNYFTNMGSSNLTDYVQARGLSGGGPGTVYLEKAVDDPVQAGRLYIDNAGSNGRAAALVENNYQFKLLRLTRYGHLDILGQNSLLVVTDPLAVNGDATFPDLSTYGIFRYSGNGTLLINGVDVTIRGDIDLVNTDDITVGDTLQGGLSLYANTWAHNNLTPYTFGDLTIGSTGRVTLFGYDDGASGINGDYGVQLNLDNLSIAAGGVMSADGNGYAYGSTANKYLSHGGFGTTGITPYGSVYQPLNLGASGGPGNVGGGAIRLTINNRLLLNGTITADGINTASQSCGSPAGAGGSIWIQTAVFDADAAGVIKANGTSQYNCSGHYPSGGRVAVYYSTGNYFDNLGSNPVTNYIQARGLSGGGPGTVYVEKVGTDQPMVGTLVVDNNGANGYSAGLLEGQYSFDSVRLTRYGHLTVIGQNSVLEIDQGTDLLGDATFPDLITEGILRYTGNDPLQINGVDVNLKGDLELTNTDDVSIGTSLQGGMTLYAHTWARNNTNQYTFGDFIIGAQGTITMVGYDNADGDYSNDYGVTLTADLVTLDAGGRITADGLGYGAGRGYGYSGGVGVHGGYGITTNAAPYGDFRRPVALGSGSAIATGGGAIKIVSQVFNLNGTISADGTSVSGVSCGTPSSPGGSIWIDTETLNGNGTAIVRANTIPIYNCGNLYPSAGRVAVHYTNGNFFDNLGSTTVYQVFQARSTAGGPGSVYVEHKGTHQPDAGDLYIDNNSVSGRGMNFEPIDYVLNSVFVGPNVTVYVPGDTVNNRGAVLDLAQDFTLGAGAVIYGQGLGYASDQGPGAGQLGAGQSGGAGGAHGGSGGNGESDGGNPTPIGGVFYGSQMQPLSLGSGGGRSGAGALGGNGGSAFAVRARSGDVNIAGTINMRGTNGLIASPGGGGGAGGSILVEGETCNVNGSLLAQGGDGGNEAFDGGGGGGGRVSILTTVGPCNVTGTISVLEGSSSSAQVGQVGTYPGIATIPAVPDFRDQFRSDAATTIPVGGTTQEQQVVLKVNMSDAGASVSNPVNLRAEFEVVTTASAFTGSPTAISSITQFEGGSPVIASANVGSLTPGGSYKWRARVTNTDESITSNWTDFGGNSLSAADFVVTTVEDLTIDVDKTNVVAGETIDVTVTARDGSNNIDTSYTGTVTFDSTSVTAIVPANYIFGGSDAGEHIFFDQLSFLEGGTYTITVTDINNSALTATSVPITVAAPTPSPSPSPSESPTPTVSGSPTVSPTATADPTPSPTTTIVRPTRTPENCSTNPNQLVCQQPVIISNVREEFLDTVHIKICWETNIETIGNIDYGLADPGILTASTDVETEYTLEHCQEIEDLEIDSAYLYRITATSRAGRGATHNDSFATGSMTSPEPTEPKACINLPENSYAFNDQHQVVITYTTVEAAACIVRYGNSPENMPNQIEEQEKLTSHTATLDLLNISNEQDLYYQIDCPVETLELECKANSIISRSVFGPYYPRTAEQPQGPVLGAVPAIAVGLVLTTLITNLFSYPRFIMFGLFWARKPKRSAPWGIVYDYETKKHIVFATLRIFSGSRMIKETVSDLEGKFSFILDQGEYRLEVSHPEYVQSNVQLKVETAEALIGVDIAMNKNLEIISKPVVKIRRWLRSNLPVINKWLVGIGFVVSVVALVLTPAIINALVVTLYLVQFVALYLIERYYRRNWGYVQETYLNSRLIGAFVRLYDVEEGRQVDVAITDAKGRFGFRVNKGRFRLAASAAGYSFPSKNQQNLIKAPSGMQFIETELKDGKAITQVILLDKTA